MTKCPPPSALTCEVVTLPVDAACEAAVADLLAAAFPGMPQAETRGRFAAYTHLALAREDGRVVGALFFSRHETARRVYWGFRMNGVSAAIQSKGVLTRMAWAGFRQLIIPEWWRCAVMRRPDRRQEVVCFARVCNPIAARAMSAVRTMEPRFVDGCPPSAWAQDVYGELREAAGIASLEVATGLCPNSAQEHGIAPQVRLDGRFPRFFQAWEATVPPGSELVIIFRVGLGMLVRNVSSRLVVLLKRALSP
ncbi:MAG: hypothetical protein VKS61_03810 [Candidatus Sericytochromatia bacterium]|nr:hypothetical protein [Candidatus Sericytochromatia bacterium]